jgi:hypothetical protein
MAVGDFRELALAEVADKRRRAGAEEPATG